MTEPKRYALFGGADHYPSGGPDDFIDWFDSVAGAKTAALEHRYNDWFQIADEDMVTLVTGSWVSRRKRHTLTWRDDA